MSDKYILNANGEPEPCEDLIEWAMFMEHGNRTVARDRDETQGPDGPYVSTVFLGFDMGLLPGRPPVLFETMVFGGPLHHHQRRYSTLQDALAGHQAVCRDVSAAALAARPSEAPGPAEGA